MHHLIKIWLFIWIQEELFVLFCRLIFSDLLNSSCINVMVANKDSRSCFSDTTSSWSFKISDKKQLFSCCNTSSWELSEGVVAAGSSGCGLELSSCDSFSLAITSSSWLLSCALSFSSNVIRWWTLSCMAAMWLLGSAVVAAIK